MAGGEVLLEREVDKSDPTEVETLEDTTFVPHELEEAQEGQGHAERDGQAEATFHAGQTLQVRITKKGYIGKVVRYKLQKGKIPSGKDLCLPPGKKKPRKRC